jgi:hypothetical protein
MKPGIYGLSGITILALSVLLAAPGQVIGAQNKKQVTWPDFTKGDAIPEGANHDWNLGTTGLRGWIYTNQMSTAAARQIYVTTVGQGSPADGILAVGDGIVGAGGKAISPSPSS